VNAPIDWQTLQRHPLGEEYANIDGDRWEAFVGHLRQHGVLNGRKVTLYEDQVLDGWQLLRGCIEAGLTPEFQPLPENIEPDVFVEIMNDLRRHEDAEATRKRAQARRARVAEMRAKGMSERAIADAEDVSRALIRADLQELSTGQGCPVEPPGGQVIGLDGKMRQASKHGKPLKKSKIKPKDDTGDGGELLDSLGNPVPPGLAPVFSKVKQFRDIVHQLKDIIRQLRDLKDGPAGVALRLGPSLTDLKNVKEATRFDTPYCVCPVCQGNAKARQANCPCKDKGWLIEETYKNLPTEFRQ
jgi:hypothetical protein